MKRKALKAAFPYTIPIFAGFWFLGLAYGIYMNVSGFSFVYPMVMSLIIFGGSLEFVAVEMLLSPFAPVQTLIMTLLIQARHLFYGISMLGKFKDMGWKKFYLIFGMCDETFSINYTAKIPDDVDKGWFMFFVTLLNHFYWVSGATIGGLVGSLIHFDTNGISFVMTAMFVVIFMGQWLKDYYNRIVCYRHYGYTLSAVYYIFRKEGYSRIYSIYREVSALCCFWYACSLLS
jgi:4-azaleucine resistance transporter AzlC